MTVQEKLYLVHTARADIPQTIDIETPRKKATEIILKNIQTVTHQKVPRIVPILGEAGFGKTHLFHALKREIGKNSYVVYCNAPSTSNQLYTHLYFSLIRDFGTAILQEVSNNLLASHKSFEEALKHYVGRELMFVEVLFALQTDEQFSVARYILTGIQVEESHFSFTSILADEELALAGLKVILENLSIPVLFFMDEMESLFLRLGEQAELQFLENLKRFYNETLNSVIVLSVITTLWDKILSLGSTSLQSRIEKPTLLKRFKKDDIIQYCRSTLQTYFQEKDITGTPDDSLWPLTDDDIEEIITISKGNPRETVRALQSKLNSRDIDIKDFCLNIQKLQGENVSFLKNIVDELQSECKKLTVGFMKQKTGSYYVINKKNTRILLVSPIPTIENETLRKHLAKLLEENNYSKILVIGDCETRQPGIEWMSKENKEKIVDTIKACFEHKKDL